MSSSHHFVRCLNHKLEGVTIAILIQKRKDTLMILVLVLYSEICLTGSTF